jgi:hypothetical protein
MTTSLVATTLNLEIRERITLKGVSHGSKTVHNISGITEVFQRIMEVPTAGTEIIQFTTKGAGAFSTGMKYMRITNKDALNFITLTFYDHLTASSADDIFAVKLEAGKSFLLGSTSFDASLSDADGLLTADQTIVEVTAKADTAAVDIEIFIGG